MRPLVRTLLFVPFSTFVVSSVGAHYLMLLPSAESGQRDQPATVILQWGHPFEHQLFDAPKPESALLFDPEGKRTDLMKSLEKIGVAGEGGKDVTAWKLTFQPERRGDYTLVVSAPPIWMGEEQFFFQDTVKVVFHVQTQKGWDKPTGAAFELVPMTRPYGLQSGMVFQAQALSEGKPLPGALVETEPYHAVPPKALPADEHMTRQVKTDPNGVLTCTLTEPGWWCIAAERDGGKREHEGKMYPVRQRAIFWVHVDDAKPAK
jgi:cobalt/nickel transport protein